jgi:uncharacterized protein YndB with AHSA1/START domain
MIAQTAVFVGASPEALYQAFLSAREHAAMTVDGARPVVLERQGTAGVDRAQAGDVLRAVGLTGPDGQRVFVVEARILDLVTGKRIVLAWKNLAWRLALDPHKVTDLASTVVLDFQSNVAGAEIQLVQIGVPDYDVRLPLTLEELADVHRAERAAAQSAPGGEVGPLSTLVNTHWSLVYWEPMKRYFHARQQ